MKSQEELDADLDRMLNGEEPTEGSVNEVKDVPENFKKWIADNGERIERAEQRGTIPYFMRDNESYWKEIQESAKLGGYEGSAKLGREATKEAFELYERKGAVKPNSYSDEQIANHREIEKALGVKQGKDMSFVEADEGRGNVDFGRGDAFMDNCQCCVVANELRRRGFNVTALGHTDDETTTPFKLGNDLALAFKNKKGNKASMVPVKTINETALGKATSAPGRYIVGYDTKKGIGHAICAERLTTGDLVFFDPQNGKAVRLNLDELASLEVLKVDGMCFNESIINSIVRAHV